MSLKNTACIAGAYEHPIRRADDKSVAQLHAEVARGALADAGLAMQDVDGYFCAGDAPGLGALSMVEYLGLKLRHVDTTETGGSSYVVHVAHAAAAIFVGPREFLAMITEGPELHSTAFFLVMGFTAILMFNFTWFREQFCVVLCPYGRLQSVLHDKESITVSYFEKRGEPRGKMAKGATAPKGDCVDCNRCVAVCPTGIDIRNGMQMECLACLQCVDACDDVMSKVKRPPNLIGFASHQQLLGQPAKVVRPRLLVYVALMVLSFGTLGVSLVTRTPFESNIIRTKGSNPFIVDGDVVRNPFEIHLVNKNPDKAKFRLQITAPVPSEVVIGTPEIELASLTDQRVPVMVTIKKEQIKCALELTLEITDEASGVVKRQPIRFLSPMGVGR